MMNNHPSQPANGFSGDEGIGFPSLSDDLRKYLSVLWHWAWLLGLITGLATILAFYLSNRQPRVYLATATILIQEPRASNSDASPLSNDRLALTYSKMMVQQPILEGVIQTLGLQFTPKEIGEAIDVQLVKDTQLIVVSVEDTDPQRAAQIANTIGLVFAEHNQASQASLYEETKLNLSAQIASTEQQIQDTLTTLDVLGAASTSDVERDLLDAQLTAYRTIYESLLQQLILADLAQNSNETQAFPDSDTLRTQLAEVNTLIQDTHLQLAELGGPSETGLERDRLESNLALYRQTYANLIQSFEQVRLAEIENTSQVKLVEPANSPTEPIRPKVLQITFLGGVVGLLVSLILIALIEILDDTIKSSEDVILQLGLPVLSIIAHIEQRADLPIAAQSPRAPVTEAFRSLRTNIQYAGGETPIRSILVTSPGPEDGKSTVSSNLAVVMAQGQKKVILVDADMRRPSLHKKFKTSNRAGLSEVLIKGQDLLKDVLHPTQIPGLTILNTGALPPNPAELMGTENMREVISKAQELSDFVIFDTPPLIVVTDPSVLAPYVDGVLLVLRIGTTKLSTAKFALQQIKRTGANILGVVLNDITPKRSPYYYYNAGYYNVDLPLRSKS